MSVAAAWLLTVATLAEAAPITFSGYLNDSANSALIYWDGTAPRFGSDIEIANNVALYSLTLAAAQSVRFDSNGHAAGGADPYFSLFSGTGGGATWLASNYDQAVLGPGGDFDVDVTLAAGSYTVALGVASNMSFAENFGVGTLADGFIGLGQANWLGSAYYELVVTSLDVPEPPGWALVLLPLSLLLRRRRSSNDSL